MQPGRSCPLHYRYAPSALARAADFSTETLYVVGGLYGNVPALEAVLELAAGEPGNTKVVFNGDFNWFNIDPAGFAAINNEVLKHAALRGNVETELASEDDAAGCGCGYPDSVSDTEVERSNAILLRLREAARSQPQLRTQLAALPMHLNVNVGNLRIAIVHGDCESLAGWSYDESALRNSAGAVRAANHCIAAGARIIASSHTCLPVALDFDTAIGHCALFNNGAAGMPNFHDTQYGVITRVSTRPTSRSLYGIRIEDIHVDALPLHYDHVRWEREFLSNWPPFSPAHASYHQRIVAGPAYKLVQAARGTVNCNPSRNQ